MEPERSSLEPMYASDESGESLETPSVAVAPEKIQAVSSTGVISEAAPIPEPITQTTIATDTTQEPYPEEVVVPKQKSPFGFNKSALAITGGVAAVIIVLGLGSILFSSNKSKNPELSAANKVSNYAVGNLSVKEVSGNATLDVGQSDHLTINGQLKVNDTLVISPSDAPSAPVAGQIYYDKNANAPYFYNGTQFISLAPNAIPQTVTSLGGSAGAIGLGDSLSITNNQLSVSSTLLQNVANSINAPRVSSFQGQTGAITLTAGSGIGISGTTITNTGVLGLVAGTNIAITNNGDGTYTVTNTSAGGASNYVANLGALTGLSTTGNSGAASTPTLSVIYGNIANTSVEGDTTLTCPSGTGNLSGGGQVITLGTGGVCGNLTITNSPTFTGDLSVLGAGGITIGVPTATDGVLNLANALNSNVGSIKISSLGQNTNYILADPGTASTQICLSSGNCAGIGGYVTGTGTNGKIAKFTGASSIADSGLSESGSTLTYNGNLIIDAAFGFTGNLLNLEVNGSSKFVVNQAGNTTVSGNLDVNGIGPSNYSGSLAVGTGLSITNGGITVSNGGANITGSVTLASLGVGLLQSSSGGLLSSGAVDRNSSAYFNQTLSVPNGGTGGTTFTSKGIIYGAGSGALLATSSAANSILATDGSSNPSLTQTLPSQVQTNITSTGALTSGSIGSGFGTISTGNDIITTGNLQGGSLTVTGGAFTVDMSGNIVTTGSATVQSAGGLILGVANTSNGSITFYNNGNAHTTTLVAPASASQNQTITIPVSTATTDTVCLLTLGNCVGSGGAVTASGGTQNYITKFTNAGANQLGNSLLYDDGTTVGVGTGATPDNSYKLDVNGALKVGTNATFGTGLTVTSGGVNVTGNSTITGTLGSLTGLTSSGTITFSGLNSSGVVHTNGSGVLSTSAVLLGTDTSGDYIQNLGSLTGLSTTGNSGAGSTPTLSVLYGSSANTAVQGNVSLTCSSGTGNLSGGGGSITLGSGGSCGAISISNSPTFSGDLAVQGSGGVSIGSPSTTAGKVVLYNATNANTTTLLSGVAGANITLTLPTTDGTNGDCIISDGTGVLSFSSCTGGAGGGVTSVNGLTGVISLANATGSGATITIDDALADGATKGIAAFNSTNFSASGGVVNTIQGIATTSTPTFAGLNLTAALTVANGGTGANTLTSNGILFGNGTGAIQATASANNSVLVTSAGGVPSLSQTLPSAVQGNITTTGALTSGSIASGFGTISTGNNITTTATVQGGTVNATTALQLGGTDINTAGTLSNVAYLNQANTFTAAGTALTVNNDAQIKGTLTVGVPGSAVGSLYLANSTTTRKVILQGLNPSVGGDATIQFPSITGGTTDTVCLLSLANCVGTGGGIAGSGTNGQIAKFTGTGTIADSTLSESGSVVTASGSLVVQGSGTLTLGTASTNTGSIAFKNSTNANTVTLQAGASGSNFTLTLPTTAGANGDCLQSNGSGALSFAACTGGAGGGVTSLDSQTGVLTLANSSGSGGTITIDNAAADGTTKGIAAFNSTNFSASSGVVNTIQNINTTATPTFGGLLLTSNAGTAASGIQFGSTQDTNLYRSAANTLKTDDTLQSGVDITSYQGTNSQISLTTFGGALPLLSAGVAPSATGSGNGTTAQLFLIANASGGDTSDTTAATAGGAGGALTVLAGAGGAQTAAGSNAHTGGAGGLSTIQGGTGGAASGGTAGTGGIGGGVKILGGTGGAGSLVQGNGGSVSIDGGAGATNGNVLIANTNLGTTFIGGSLVVGNINPTGTSTGIELGNTNVASASPFLDFHYGVGSSQDYNIRVSNNANNTLSILSNSGSALLSVTGGITATTSVTTPTVTSTGALTVAAGGTNTNLSLDGNGTGQVLVGGTSTGDILLGGGSGSTGCTVTNASGNFACTGTINGGTITGGTLSATAVNSLNVGANAISTGSGNLTVDANGSGTISIGGTSTGDIDLGGGSGSTGCTLTNASGNWACTGTINGATISGGTLSGGSFSGGTVTGGTLTATAVNSLNVSGTAISGTGALTIAAGGTNTNLSLDGNGTGQVLVGGTSTGDILLGGGSGSTGCTLTNASGNWACTGTITGTTLNGTTGINTGAGAGSQRIDATGNLVNIGTITSGLINGQTISSAANFTGTLTVQGSSLTVGDPGTTTGSIYLANSTSTRKVILQGLNPSVGGDATIQFPSITGGNTDTVCLLTLANCVGMGGSIAGSGTAGNIPVFTGTNSIGNSGLSESGTTLTYAGNAVVNTANGFTGNILNLLVNSSSKLSVNQNGDTTQSGTLTVNGAGASYIAGSLQVANGLTVTTNGASITGASTISGGTVSINASSNNNTNINTGTSTGTVAIGNSSSGSVTLQSGSTVNLTAATASTYQTLAGDLTIQGGSGNVSLGTSTVLTNTTGGLAVTAGGAAQNLTLNGSTSGTVSIGGTSTGDILLGGGVGSTGCTVTNSSGNFACTATITGATLNGTSAIQLNGVSINTAGTLTNVAYLNQANTFTSAQTIKPSSGSSSALAVLGQYDNVALSVDTSNTSNFLQNGHFEAGTSGWSNITGGTLTQQTTYSNAFASQASGQIVTTATAGAGARTNSFTSTIGAGVYYLTFYAKISSGTFTTLSAGWDEGSGDTTCTLNSNTVLTTGFQKYQCIFGPTANVTSIFIKQTDATARTIYIDNVTVTNLFGSTVYGYDSQLFFGGRIAGQAVFSANSNSTNAFEIQSASGGQLLVADTINNKLGILGQPTSSGATLQVTGSLSTTTSATIGNTLTVTAGGATITAGGLVVSAGGISSVGSGAGSTQVFGFGATASNTEAQAFGYNASATGVKNTAVGYAASAANNNATAIGNIAQATFNQTVALGYDAQATSNQATALGTSTRTTGGGVAVGYTAQATSGVALGNAANSSTGQAIALGSNTTASGNYAIALGNSSTASAGNAIAIGGSSSAAFTNSIAIGESATTTAANQLVIGSSAGSVTSMYLGSGVTAVTPQAASINATGGSGTDVAGANLVIASGRGTGNAAAGNILFQTSTPGASGATLRTLATRVAIPSNFDGFTFGSAGDTNLYRSAADTLKTDDALTVGALLTGQLGATISGATINLNASSNFATNINTGTSTGAVSIGNNTGNTAITVDSGTSAINIGTGAQARAINIGTGGAAQTVTLGSTNSTSPTTIQGGTSGITLTTGGGTGDILVVANLVASGSATGTTATTSGTGTDTTTLTFSGTTSFANDDVIFIDNAGQDYYTRIVSGGTAASVTVSPAVTFETGRTVTKYTVQNIGSSTNATPASNNERFFQGYFLGGVVTGAGSTTLSDGKLQSSTYLNLLGASASTFATTAGNLTLQAGSGTVSLGSSTALTATGALTVSSGGSSALALSAGTTFSFSGTNATLNTTGQLSLATSGSTGGIVLGGDSLANLYRSAANTLKTDGTLSIANTTGATPLTLDSTGNPAAHISFKVGGTQVAKIVTNTTQTFFDGLGAGSTFLRSTSDLEFRAGGIANATSFTLGGTNGTALFKNTTDSTTAFQIQNNAGTSNLLVADTSNTRIGIGAAPANSLLTIGTATTTAAGGITFGTDTNLYRSAADTLKTDDVLVVGGNGVGNVTIGGAGGGNPGILFGSGGDTNLYRSAADTLKTDDALTVVGSITGQAGITVSGSSNTFSLTSTAISGVNTMTSNNLTVSPASGPGSLTDFVSFQSNTTVGNTNVNANSRLFGIYGNTQNTTAGATLGSGYGVRGIITNSNTGSINDAYGVNGVIQNSSTGTISTAYGLYAQAAVNSGGGTITNNYGIYVDPQTAGSSDVGIYIGAADTYSLQLGGTGGTASTGITFGTDTNLYRSGANVLATDDSFSVNSSNIYLSSSGNLYAVGQISSELAGDTNTRVALNQAAGGASKAGILFGPGNATPDVNLYRDAADVLKTDDRLVVSSAAENVTNGYTLGVSGSLTSTSNNQNGLRVTSAIAPSSASTRSYSGIQGLPSVTSNANVSGASISGINGGVYADVGASNTLGEAIGAYVQNYAPSGTVTTSKGLMVYNPDLTGGGGITNNYGIDIQSMTAGTVDIGLRIARADTYTLQLSDTGGTAAGGITFGTDTNLYRSAANTLKTDDTLQSAVDITSYVGTNSQVSLTSFGGVLPMILGGVTPSAVGSGNGTAAQAFLIVNSPGGNTSDTTGGTAGGAGGALNVTAGSGGSQTAGGSNAHTGGAGGAATLQGGAGGTASGGTNGTGGAGGAVSITGGTGGAGSLATGNGGSVTINGGTGASTGNVSIQSSGGNTFVGGTLSVGPAANQYVTIAGGATNHGIQIGRIDGTSSTPYFDFNAGATAVDYDVRLQATVGTGTTGAGTLVVSAQNVQLGAGYTSGTLKADIAGTQTNFAVCHSGATGTTDDVQIVDCGAGPWADYAEMYPTEPGVGAGDLVMIGPNYAITTTKGERLSKLTKSTSSYQNGLLGIISDPNDASDFNVIGYNIAEADNPRAMALNGRVTTKVNDEGGAIHAGDLITSSSVPGVGMKADPNHAGMVVGVALDDYTGSGQGSVLVFVNPHYYTPPQSQQLQNGTFNDMDVQGTTTTAALSVTGTATINNLTVTGDAVFEGTLTVTSIKVVDIEVSGHIITKGGAPIGNILAAAGSGATVNINGNDTSGTITITTGASGVAAGDLTKVDFSKVFGKTPKVLLTGQDDNSVNARIYPKAKTLNDFMLSTGQTLAPNTTYTFDYFIVE